jgi:hypothetical protein
VAFTGAGPRPAAGSGREFFLPKCAKGDHTVHFHKARGTSGPAHVTICANGKHRDEPRELYLGACKHGDKKLSWDKPNGTNGLYILCVGDADKDGAHNELYERKHGKCGHGKTLKLSDEGPYTSNTAGAQGPPGPAGPAGPPGAPGAPGTNGTNGLSPIYGGGMLTVNSATAYVAPGQQYVDPTEANTETPIGLTGTLSNLHVLLTVAPGAGASWTFTVDKNGVATGLTCTVTSAGTTCSSSATVSISSSDSIDLKAVPATSPTTPTHVAWSATVSNP